MSYLKENLETRKPLNFRNGRFRILVFSDIHGIKNYDTRLLRDMNSIIDGTDPDIVLLNGDIGWKDAVTDEETFRNFITDVVSPMESRKIPWAHVFGNHDDEKGLLNEVQQNIYEEFEYCLTKRGPENVAGTGNYVLPVKNEADDKIIFNIWGLDSHDNFKDYIKEFRLNEDPWFFRLPDPLFPNSNYDSVRFNQIMWYWNSSDEINEYVGNPVPGMMFFHIPIPQFVTLYRNSAQTHYQGLRRESVGNSPIDSGLFNALVERGEVKTVICGHDHINDFEGDYCNIRLAMDGGLSYDGYCDEDIRGGRIVDVYEDNPAEVDTYMVRSSRFVTDYPGVERRVFDK